VLFLPVQQAGVTHTKEICQRLNLIIGNKAFPFFDAKYSQVGKLPTLEL